MVGARTPTCMVPSTTVAEVLPQLVRCGELHFKIRSTSHALLSLGESAFLSFADMSSHVLRQQVLSHGHDCRLGRKEGNSSTRIATVLTAIQGEELNG